MGPASAGNGSLMRALATGLVRTDPSRRARDAADVSAITHAYPRCVDSCMAHVDVVDELVAGTDPLTAIARSAGEPARRSDVREVLETAPRQPIQELRPTGYVLDTLAVGVWALCQPRSLEETLVDVVNLGGDADTTGAVAGGLLGAPDGIGAIPKRWHQQLEYAPAYDELADQLLERRLSQQ